MRNEGQEEEVEEEKEQEREDGKEAEQVGPDLHRVSLL